VFYIVIVFFIKFLCFAKIEIPSGDDEEEEDEIESHLEVIFHSGDLSLEALNFALGTRSANDAEVLVSVKIGTLYKRQLEPLPVSTVMALKKDTAHFSMFDGDGEEQMMTVGVFLAVKSSTTREMIGKMEISLASLLKIGDKVMLPLVSKDGDDVGRISLLSNKRVGPSPRQAIISSRVSFTTTPPKHDIPLATQFRFEKKKQEKLFSIIFCFPFVVQHDMQ
jgi:hypothetical protein